MPKVKYLAVEDKIEIVLEDNYPSGGMFLFDDLKSAAGYDDSETGFQVYLFGSGFKYDEGGLTKGNVDEIQFRTFEGQIFATVTDFKLTAAKINHQLTSESGVSGLLQKLLQHNDSISGTAAANDLSGRAGDDVIKAKGGDDFVTGNAGDDTMSGGGGNDVFRFLGNSGTDVITDFNVGDGEVFDLLFIRNVGFSFGKTAENDLRIKFEDGSSVVLEGVGFSERNDVTVDAIL